MAYSEDFKQFINDKVWDYLPPSKVKVGHEIHVRCPICGDSKKNPRKKRGYFFLSSSSYYCFNCGVSMSGMQFLKHIAGAEFEDIKNEYLRMKIRSGNLSSQMNIGLDFNNSQLSAVSYLNSLHTAIKPEWRNP